ncbi:hypothetical protein I4F81_006433 [Pyropia yezoensis]|uniref:Uncharacterized protein n=1 Tax=Pyropia yezoensis TaxID=2788 RepID=A0ACC3C103_PYRYE|nr:hypothetical protein I4F81_006433 [Neopyropia yezoensis]
MNGGGPPAGAAADSTPSSAPPTVALPVDVPPGAPRVGRYALLNIVGEGGFGVVRRAVHLDTGMIVAVKVMDKHQLRLNNMSPQVKREIAVLTVLRHPNIVAGYEVLTSRARIFVVMEYVDGGELFTLLARHRRLDEPTVKYLFYQLLDGLHYCHQRGVFHRDLKLENLLLDREGRLKIADFGLSFVKAAAASADDLLHTVVGSDDFLSPEVVRRLPYHGDKVDAWSSGIVLYVLLAGFLPFRAAKGMSLAEAITGGMLSFPDHFSGDAIDVIRRLLANDPQRRPPVGALRRHRWFADVPGTEAHAIASSSMPAARRLSASALPDVDEDEARSEAPMLDSAGLPATPSGMTLAVPAVLARQETYGPPPPLPTTPPIVFPGVGGAGVSNAQTPSPVAGGSRRPPPRDAKSEPWAASVSQGGGLAAAAPPDAAAVGSSSMLPTHAPDVPPTPSEYTLFTPSIRDRILPDAQPRAARPPVQPSSSVPDGRMVRSRSPSSSTSPGGRGFGVSTSAGHLQSGRGHPDATPAVGSSSTPLAPGMQLDDATLMSSMRKIRLGSASGVFDEGADDADSDDDSDAEPESPTSSRSGTSVDQLLNKISVSTSSSSNAGAVWKRFKRPSHRATASSGAPDSSRANGDGFETSSARTSEHSGIPENMSKRTSSTEPESHRSFMSLAIRNIADFSRTYEAMRDTRTGVPVADRRYRLKLYPRTFVGSEAVLWMVKNLRLSQMAAIVLGREMINAGVFHHVCHAHTFKDEYLFYRWEEDEQRDKRVLNAVVAWSGPPCPEPVHLSVSLLAQLMNVMRKHQTLPIDAELTQEGAGEIDMDALEMSEDWRSYIQAAAELQSVSLLSLRGRNERLAFFVNVYNLLALHAAVSRRGVPVAARARRQFFRRVFYDIGALNWSLDDIHHGVLRANAASPVRVGWRAQFPPSDRRYRLALPYLEPLAHFVLSVGVRDISPPIRPLTAASVAEGSILTTAAASFLTSTVSVSVSQRRVTLPRIFLQYPGDFDKPEAALLSWVAKMLTPAPEAPESPAASKRALLAAQIRSLLRGGGLTPQVSYQAVEGGGDGEVLPLAPVFIM